MDGPALYPGRSRVERPDRAHARVLVPYSGELNMRLRRRASALLRQSAVDGQQLRAVAIALEPGYMIVTAAGTENAIDDWTTSGKLARAAALAVSEAHDETQREPDTATRLARLHPTAPARQRQSRWRQAAPAPRQTP